MENNINSTELSASFTNITMCPSYTQNSLILIISTIDWTLALPSVSWALWFLIRQIRLTLKTEFFMFNLFLLDMFYGLFCPGMYFNDRFIHNDIFHACGLIIFLFVLYGHPNFQCCICIERYMAVVHPVTFLKFRHVRYKVAALMLVWPITLAFSFVHYVKNELYVLLAYLILVACIELFCSLSILRVLKNAGPGDELKRKERERSNAAKKKAFAIVLMFQIKQLLNYMPFVIITLIRGALPQDLYNCYLFSTSLTICLFGNFVEAFHYLQRTGRFPRVLGL